MGRKSRRRWAPRIVDLDILFYGNVVFSDDELSVPHNQMIHRKFVLQPLCDLVPDFVHPDLSMTIKEILENTSDTLQLKPLE